MIKFGTGGWRAVIGDDFTKANVQLLMAAMARMLRDEGVSGDGFLIGYDRRFLSEEATKWAAEVMAGEGIYCRIIQRESPTPLIMYAVERYHLPYGMAVTASHNPASYNGIKIFMQGGRDADEELTEKIEGYISRLSPGEIQVMDYEDGIKSGAIELIDPMNAYIDSILHVINVDAIRKRRLRVVLDPMYGVGKTALQTILLTVRCEVEVIHERRDALFGGRLPAPNEKTLAELRNFVEEHRCDIGLATDGDADRLGVIDDQGQFLHPNKILVLLYYYLIAYKGWNGSAVRNIATTHLLDRIAGDFGEECYEVPVGFKFISAQMAKANAIIGGESSGGLTVRGHIQGKDGIYAAALLAEMLAVTGKPLSQLWREITQKYGSLEMEERDYTFSHQEKERLTRTLMADKRLPAFPWEVDHVSYEDGCKVYFKNGGWVVARFSGTEPLLRVFCEMETLQDARAGANMMEAFLELGQK